MCNRSEIWICALVRESRLRRLSPKLNSFDGFVHFSLTKSRLFDETLKHRWSDCNRAYKFDDHLQSLRSKRDYAKWYLDFVECYKSIQKSSLRTRLVCALSFLLCNSFVESVSQKIVDFRSFIRRMRLSKFWRKEKPERFCRFRLISFRFLLCTLFESAEFRFDRKVLRSYVH